MDTLSYLRLHPVFNLQEAEAALEPAGGRTATRERLKYHLERGRLKSLARGLYASVPPGRDPRRFHPDPFLVAAAARPDVVFSHHSALELLGVAHSAWSLVTVFTETRRPMLELADAHILFLDHPFALRRTARQDLGVRTVARADRMLRVTGPERTLLDGFRQPDLAGGVEELVASASAFPVLDLDSLLEILVAYDSKGLWAAAGWFLERYQRTFYVPAEYLVELRRHTPKAPQYLVRGQRGGELSPRWSLIVPTSLGGGREPDER